MSGFGGGFGSQQPFGSSNFGAAPGFGGGFATNPTNASPPTSNPAYGSAGGFSSAPAFGQPAVPQQPGAIAFGVSPNVIPSFNNSQPFQGTSGLGQSVNFSGFGPATSNFNSSQFPQQSSSNQQGFSNSNIGASPFGTTTSHPPSSFQTPSSGNSAGNPFGGMVPPSHNPFGSVSGGTTMSFGASSSLMPSGPRFGKNNEKKSRSNAPFGMSPFGIASRMRDNEEIMEDEPAPATNLPFGTPVSVGSSKTRNPPAKSTIVKEQNQMSSIQDDVETSKQDLLAKLKAKKDKLMRLAEKKNKAKSNNDGTTLNPNATVFEPRNKPEEQNNSLAEKNAVRFAGATNQATRALMPSELAGAAVDYASLRVEGRKDRENLENAVSLVGTCTFMCPDEELLRRERESDIQLLEIPLPGKLHPSDWTLRNTVVKRFRRSAADYKLDVPEWVRPPAVLERVCSYLEEWVMERDRQGPDPRFPNSGTPPPLDVYQFIWDRTRMVRKDFTLQNYVGTGGNCDARAVRCHERICRWHTMCEHQLSHIQEFVSMQSQQNIQELGQTMKTLNQLYDDSLGRSTIEVPDKRGAETERNLSTYKYGCTEDTVQGVIPIDYDGTTLKNEMDTRSLFGSAVGQSPSRGTAEPEMRGLYILLTIDNDGGMEVLKYAARLFRDRPELYHSRPVQLALSIYKAKKENNYARFFKILKSSSTPYLFACLMFKHVEHMRKKAFEICNKAYGGRTKDGDTLYDSYPLKRWEALLCYEDIDEARNACKHYNITVKKQPYKSSSGRMREEEFITWKSSFFSEPRDPDKGVIIVLRPKKMIKTIESKLNGATRLAVCRGALSGKGSVLSEMVGSPRLDVDLRVSDDREAAVHLEEERKEEMIRNREKEKADLSLKQQREEEDLRKSREEERKRVEHERAEQEAAKRRKELEDAAAKRRKELEDAAAKRQAEEALKMKAEKEEILRREKEKEEARKREEQSNLEAIKERERLQKVEQQRRKEAEERRLQEEERQRRAALEAEKLRVEREIKRKQDEERRLREIEESKRRKERQLDEEKAVAMHSEWKERADILRKELFFKRMINRIPYKILIAEKSENSLKLLYEKSSHTEETIWIEDTCVYPTPEKGLRRSVEFLMTSQNCIDVRSIFQKAMTDRCKRVIMHPNGGSRGKISYLLKLSVNVISSEDRPMRELLRKWLDFNFHFGEIYLSTKRMSDIRLVLVDATEKSIAESFDAAIFFLPSSVSSEENIFDTAVTVNKSSEGLPDHTPRIALMMTEEGSVDTNTTTLVESNSFFPVHVEKAFSDIPDNLQKGVEASLATALEEISLKSAVLISRVSVSRLCYLCVNEIVWQSFCLEAHDILTSAFNVLDHLIEAIVSYSQKIDKNWPPMEFLDKDRNVPDYFGDGLHLPAQWYESLRRCVIEPKVMKIQSLFSCKLSVVIQKMLAAAPSDVVSDCMSMLNQRLFRRCFERALCWAVQADDAIHHDDADCVYLPNGSLDELIKVAAQRLEEKIKQQCESSRRVLRALDDSSWRTMTLSPRSPKSDNIASNRTPIVISAISGVESSTKSELSPSKTSVTVPSPDKKRTRKDSLVVTESKAMTKKLRAMAQGGLAKDMVVGHTTLSSLLKDDTISSKF